MTMFYFHHIRTVLKDTLSEPQYFLNKKSASPNDWILCRFILKLSFFNILNLFLRFFFFNHSNSGKTTGCIEMTLSLKLCEAEIIHYYWTVYRCFDLPYVGLISQLNVNIPTQYKIFRLTNMSGCLRSNNQNCFRQRQIITCSIKDKTNLNKNSSLRWFN